MKNKNSFWMLVSGLTGFTFFIIANFTKIFVGSDIIAGFLQLTINTFVFIVWIKAFTQSAGFKKFIAFWGVVVPAIMAATTIIRVLIPSLFR